MFITPSFKKSLIVEQFQGNYLKSTDIFASGFNMKSSIFSLNHLVVIRFSFW